MNPTKREKVLLMLLGAVALVALAVLLVIQPLQTAEKALKDERAVLEDSAMALRSIVSSEADIRASYDSSLMTRQAAEAKFPGREKSYDVHTFLTARADACNVTVESLAMGEFAPVMTSTNAALSDGSYTLYVLNANMTLRGTLENLLTLEDSLQHAKDNVCVSGFSVLGLDDVELAEKTATVLLRIYAVDASVAVSE